VSDLDSPWKEALEQFLPAFLAFFFPDCHAAIDWGKDYESLDTELQQIVADAELGRRLADKLFRVYRKDGQETWVLIHVEMQNQPDEQFAERMYIYNYRIYDRFRRPVVSLAVLGDERASWRPSEFGYELWGCGIRLTFPTVKLLDYHQDLAKLEGDRNPFGLIVLAHLQTAATRQDAHARQAWKVRLVKGLFDQGLKAKAIRQMFRLIDWMMELPRELELEFRAEIRNFEEERKMPYITSVERLALEEGREEGRELGRELGREEGQLIGLADGIALAVEVKYGKEGLKSLPQIPSLRNLKLLHSLQDAIRADATLEELRERMTQPENGAIG